MGHPRARLSTSIFLRMNHTIRTWIALRKGTTLAREPLFGQSHPLNIACVGNTTGECGRIVGTSGVLAQKDGFKWVPMQRIAPGDGGAQNREQPRNQTEGWHIIHGLEGRNIGGTSPSRPCSNAHLVATAAPKGASQITGAHPSHRTRRMPVCNGRRVAHRIDKDPCINPPILRHNATH